MTDDGWKLFGERLARAWTILEKIEDARDQYPDWTPAAQTVALGQGWDRERYLKMVGEAIKREPTYGEYYNNAIYWLLPRWHGEEGDFEQWIAGLADESPAGDKHYAMLVWQVDGLGWPEEMVFAKGRLDWERTKRGFNLWAKELPENLPIRFEFFRLALLASDRATAREQLEVTGGKYWKPNWHGKSAEFEKARQFAYHNGPNPLRSAQSATSKRATFSPQVLQVIKWIGQGVGGLLAGLFCLIFAIQRKRPLPGVLMLIISVVLALLNGTIAAAVPCAVFVIYLFSKEPGDLAPRPPHSWGLTLFWVLLVMGFYLFAQIIATILALVPGMAAQNFEVTSPRTLAAQMFTSGEGFRIIFNSQWLSLLLLLAIGGRQSPAGWKARLGLHPVNWRRAVVWIVIAQLVVMVAGYLLMKNDDPKTKASMEMISGGLQSPWIFILALVVLAPVLEELVMRGYAFQGWLPKLGAVGTGVLTTLIFTAIHLQYGWVGLVQVTILGAALAWLRCKTGSVYPCIALHVINNSLYALTLFFENK